MAAVEHHGGGLCVDALEEAVARCGHPAIFNIDRGRQFTSARFAEVLRLDFGAGLASTREEGIFFERWEDCQS